MTREMKDSGIEWIGAIPTDWNTIKFKYTNNGLNTGESIDKEYWTEEDTGHVFYTAGVEPIHTTYKDFPEEKYTHENDLLLARNGTPYVYFPLVNACYSDHIIRAEIKDQYDKKYIRYCLQQSIGSIVVDSVSLATWSASLWNEQVFPLPTLIEQRHIAAFLDRKCSDIDAVIAKTQATIEEYKALKQSIITEAVTKGVRGKRPMKDSGVEWIGEIPEEWSRRKISHYAKFYNGDRTSRYPKPEELQDNGIPFLSSREINGDVVDIKNTKYISEEKYVSLSGAKLQIGDIVFCLRGSIGKCAINLTLTEGTVASSLMTIRPSGVNGQFLLYYLFSDIVNTQTLLFMNGTCAANLSAENVGGYVFLVPPISEQAEIVSYLDDKCQEIEQLIFAKEQLLAELDTYKKSLIYEYVTGKKDVN